MRTWSDWHRDYDHDTPLARRLAAVQRFIGRLFTFVTEKQAGPVGQSR